MSFGAAKRLTVMTPAAFEELVRPFRRELAAHCYRMLGSMQDSEDALQEALLRAWKGMSRFEGRSSLRSWLYKISTNTCLDAIGKRPKRVLPVDYGPNGVPAEGPGMPVVEQVWIEPFPDEQLDIADGYASPEARYEQRESVELAFVAALQLLPANQRAALIMREVLGYSAQEVADQLETSVQSVNSALQRARKTIDDRLPDQSQQETLRSMGDEQTKALVENFMKAMAGGDIDAVVGMLADDAAWTMPPAAEWYLGLAEIEEFLGVGPLSGEWRWRHIAVRANGGWASAAYAWLESEGAYLPFALDVLTIEDGKIKEIDSFICRTTDDPDPGAYARWPEMPLEPAKTAAVFGSFGLPARID